MMAHKKNIDDLGRIHIPKEIRKQLGIEYGAECQIEVKGKSIVISRSEKLCVGCDKPADIEFRPGVYICKKCAEEIRKKG